VNALPHPSATSSDLADLTRRVAALEGYCFHTQRHRAALLQLLNAWPGPFTIQQISAALEQRDPGTFAELKPHFISSTILSLEKKSLLIRRTQGAGCVAAIFETAGPIDLHAKRPGQKYNRRARYESGFRAIVRAAIASEDLPEPFRLDDLRRWVEAHYPHSTIPYGSWASTLYKLQSHNELTVLNKRASHYLRGKIYARGPVRVAPSGDELTALEHSWNEFRKTITLTSGPLADLEQKSDEHFA
jgi:hypothetical protein